jgi:arylsulfatase A-like enzyme
VKAGVQAFASQISWDRNRNAMMFKLPRFARTWVNSSRSAPDLSDIRGLFAVSIWMALVTWLAELAVQVTRNVVWGRLHLINHTLLILGPLGYVLLFLAAGLLFSVIRRTLSSAGFVRALIGTFFFFCAFSILLIFEANLGPVPTVMLALGIATQLTRIVSPRQAGFGHLIGKTMAYLVVAAGTLGGGYCLMLVAQEFYAALRLPKANPEAPNVVFITLDTVRASSLSLYGSDRNTTPFLTQLSKQGVSFDWAIVPAPWTIASHASMFTGRPAADLIPRTESPLPDEVPTLAERLGREGYQTAAFVGNLYFLGRDTGLNRGFAHYESFRFSFGQFLLSFQPGRALTNLPSFRSLVGFHDTFNRKAAEEVSSEFLHWLSTERQPGRPFFAFLNYFDAHEPYLPPEPYRSRFSRPGTEPLYRYDTDRVERLDAEKAPPETELGGQIGKYEGQIAHLDEELGRMIAELQRRDLLRNTLLIITADHGEAFGEHGLLGHFNNMHIQTLRVPLVMSFPGRIPAGIEVRHPVSLRRIPATVMDLIGLSENSRFPGASLSEYWESKSAAAQRDPDIIESRRAGLDNMRSIIRWPYHYILVTPKRQELYNLNDDPEERRNLSTFDEFGPLVDSMRRLAY